MDPFRRSLLWSGLAGLFFEGLLVTLSTWLVATGAIRPLLPQRLVTFLIVLLLGGISVAEVPLMVFAMRRLASERTGNRTFVLGLNALYVFFAGVYATPVLLLTGNRAWGWILAALGMLRLATSLLLVPGRALKTPSDHARNKVDPDAP